MSTFIRKARHKHDFLSFILLDGLVKLMVLHQPNDFLVPPEVLPAYTAVWVADIRLQLRSNWNVWPKISQNDSRENYSVIRALNVIWPYLKFQKTVECWHNIHNAGHSLLWLKCLQWAWKSLPGCLPHHQKRVSALGSTSSLWIHSLPVICCTDLN